VQLANFMLLVVLLKRGAWAHVVVTIIDEPEVVLVWRVFLGSKHTLIAYHCWLALYINYQSYLLIC
jgi:hypothetical protein